MNCDRFEGAIGELVDGTIDATSRAALEAHLTECAACRSLASDLRHLRERVATLDRVTPPNRVWTAIQRTLEAEDQGARSGWSIASLAPIAARASWQGLAAAAVVVLVAGTALWMVPNLRAPDPTTGATTADAADPTIESVEAELRLAEEHYENAIIGLEAIARISALEEDELLDPDVSATLQKNPRGHRPGDRREPRGRARRACQSGGPGEPVRRDVA